MKKTEKHNEERQHVSVRPRVRAFVQPTGGAGKTTTLVRLAEAINAVPGRKALPIDVDPESATLTHHKALGPVRINVMNEQQSEVDQLQYSTLFNAIAEAPLRGYTDILLDPGASGYRGLVTWLMSQGVVGFLEAIGFDFELHYVIPGNARKEEAYKDLAFILRSFPAQLVTLWLNPIQESCRLDGKDFTETDLYAAHRDRFKAVVRLPQMDAAFRDTFMRLLQHGMTYEEALAPAETLLEDIRRAIGGGGVTSGALAKMPPGLNDPLAPSRIVAIRTWIDQAIGAAPGVL